MTENIFEAFQGMGVNIKTQLNITVQNIRKSDMDAEQKKFYLNQVKAIEDSIANPSGGIHKIMQTIQQLNDTNNKP